MTKEDKIVEDIVVMEFTVLWKDWECDSKAWVMERADGTHYLKMTNHGEEYKVEPSELIERIKLYGEVLDRSRDALLLLNEIRP